MDIYTFFILNLGNSFVLFNLLTLAIKKVKNFYYYNFAVDFMLYS
jgi:hypothetical protein